MELRGLVVRGLVLAAAGAVPAAQPVRPSMAVTFESRRAGEIIVPVFIGSDGPFRFLLDTGSSHSSVTTDLARRVGAIAVAQTPVATATGIEMRPIVRLTSLKIGPVSMDGILATGLPSQAVAALGPEVDGVVGQDFLSGFDYTLDYRRSRVVWGEDGASSAAVRLTLEASEGRVLVQLPQDDGCRCRLRFVPDSGTDGLVLFDAGHGLPLAVTRGRGRFSVQSLNGSAAAEMVTLHRLQIGRTSLRGHPAALVKIEDGGPDRGDGLLPLHLFSRVYFNNRDRYVRIE